MREIKFRAWDKSRNQWADRLRWGTGIYKDGTCYVGGSDNLELCLFTGLKDKNGKEIYEGDIIRSVRDSGKEPIWEVLWRYSGWIMVLKARPLMHEYALPLTVDDEVVIGNIYENPGLIKEAG